MIEKGYIFISNSSKPRMSVPKPLEIDIDNFSQAAVYAADKRSYKIYLGYNVDHPENLKCKQYDITYFHSNIYRNIFAFRDNYKAYKILCKLLRNHPEIEVVHCNTPIGGVLGRIVGHKFKKKVIYTAHGFHFFKGAPLLNWLLYYPVEKILARWTDVLITINKEDFSEGKKLMSSPHQKCYLVPGVGIDLNLYHKNNEKREIIRKKFNLSDSDIMCISMGDLIDRKNYSVSIKAIKRVGLNNLHYFICGDGPKKDELENLVKSLNLEKQVHFLGRRNDIKDLLQGADVFLFSTKQEGLARSLMEAMAFGLPCVASNIRGNIDLIQNGEGGYLYSPTDIEGFAEGIKKISTSKDLRKSMSKINLEKIKDFSLEASKKTFLEIFQQELSGFESKSTVN